MKFRTLASAMLFSFIFLSCVSNKKFEQAQNAARSTRDSLMGVNSNLLASLNTCKDSVNAKDKRISELQYQNSFLKENNTQALKQLQDLSVITSTQAESIKKSMENIGVKDMYIMDLQKEMAKKDSLNMALVMNLKGAIGNLSDEDINIKVDKGVVFIDISDKLLFKSGKYDITDRAKEVLGKVALVLKNQPDLEFMVEGHTDSIPYKRPPLLDNWDLSVKRATAVVRVLQNEYGLSPYHITAAGRSEYQPVASNATEEGRALNRRTRIVILPQLDQFFKLLETK
ncbi:MAG TPA: OmpA family protein [Puia sp.]|jgi:chemotaxis protein MotB|nr:OmpA family protein [Puia sp.]